MLVGFGAELADERAVFKQRLGGDAAPVQAGAAEVFLLDAEDALLELAGADGGGIAGGAAADDDDVVVVVAGLLRRRRDAASHGVCLTGPGVGRRRCAAAQPAGAATGSQRPELAACRRRSSAPYRPHACFFTSSGFSLRRGDHAQDRADRGLLALRHEDRRQRAAVERSPSP